MILLPLPRLVFPRHAPLFWPPRTCRLCSIPKDLSPRVPRDLRQGFEHPDKNSFLEPLLEAAVASLVGRVAFWKVLPGSSRTHYPEDAVRMPFKTSRGSRQGLPRRSSLRGGSGIRGSNTSHCSSVRSMQLYFSC